MCVLRSDQGPRELDAIVKIVQSFLSRVECRGLVLRTLLTSVGTISSYPESSWLSADDAYSQVRATDLRK